MCVATSGPGAIHLLNGLYDAKLDHVPVVAIVGQTNRSAMGGSYQQEVDLLSLFKDVASDYVQMVTVPEQLPNVLDRAIRMALAERAPTAIIIPSDVQELEYSGTDARVQDGAVQPRHRLADRRRRTTTRSAGRPRSSTPGRRSPSWSARAPAGHARRADQVADLLGAGVAKALLGKDVLSDDLPYVTGSIGLLGTRPSYEMMLELRHAADGRLELPLYPVHARPSIRPAPCRSTSTPSGSACAIRTRSTSSATPRPRCGR